MVAIATVQINLVETAVDGDRYSKLFDEKYLDRRPSNKETCSIPPIGEDGSPGLFAACASTHAREIILKQYRNDYAKEHKMVIRLVLERLL